MDPLRPLRLAPSAALKEKRLATLLAGRNRRDAVLAEAVEDAQVVGSLELAGLAATPEQVRAARRGEDAPAPVRGLLRALKAVDRRAPLSVRALVAWNAAATGGAGTLRTSERSRAEGPAPAPAEFVPSRLALLEEWMNVESSRELKPVQQGALVMARIVEILPFEEANGRVARLAASHVMVREGMRPPILLGGERSRLAEALRAAFQFHTEPLCALLDEASERALDVMIRMLEAQGTA